MSKPRSGPGELEFTDEEWDQLMQIAREIDEAEHKRWTQQLYNGPNGDFWRFVDEKIREVATQ